MSEFKGTKGKWIITYPKGSNGFIYVGEKINEGNIATCYTVDNSEWNENITEETKANALLISKAPEMLEMLNFIVENVDISMYAQEKIEKLIKEATTL